MPTGPPPRFICARRRVDIRPRRGRITPPPPFVPPLAPGIWQPGPVVARRRPGPLPRIHGRRFDPPWPQIIPPEFAPAYGTVLLTDQTTGITTLAEHDSGTVLLADQASGTVQPASHDTGTVHPTGQATGGVTPT
ncbi:MAG TPA: hypothetical protein VIV12_29775 [Streptosporangiaceae bacterium]